MNLKISDIKDAVKKDLLNYGLDVNIDNPKTIQEKLAWLKVYDVIPLKTMCADKLLLPIYCKEKLGKNICVPVYTEYESANDIIFELLPNSFVLKCNHGSGMVIAVKDKNSINKYTFDEYRKRLNEWKNYDFSERAAEYHYKDIVPKIFAEKFLCENLIDYKICCFNGEPKILEICFDRDLEKHTVTYNFYDEYLNPLYISELSTPANYDVDINLIKPKQFELMMEYAKKLSKDFKFVRVDFYEVDNKVYLGELTFTPAAGHLQYNESDNKEISLYFGNMLNL